MDSYAALWLGKAYVMQLHETEMEECPLGMQVSQAGSCGMPSPVYNTQSNPENFSTSCYRGMWSGAGVPTLDSIGVFLWGIWAATADGTVKEF